MMTYGTILRNNRLNVLVVSDRRRGFAIAIASGHGDDNRKREQRARDHAKTNCSSPKNHFTSAIKHPMAGPPAAGGGLPARIASSACSKSFAVGSNRCFPKST